MPALHASAPPRRIRIPLLLDVVLVDHLAQIAELDASPDLTRVVQHHGPLVNRILSRRIARAFTIGARPLPTFTDRTDAPRASRQRELEGRLTGATTGLDGPEIGEMASYVQGGGDPERAGIAVQTVFGRLFDPTFRATADTYRAACLVRDFPRALPPRSWWWLLSGKLAQSQRLLGGVAGGDPIAIHATTNTVHNVVETLTRMRTLAAGGGARVAAAEAIERCLAAPPALIRWCTRATRVAGVRKPLHRGTLVMMRLDKAHDELKDAASPFLVGCWNQCPAHQYVTVLLGRVWTAAARNP
jgi:hypothetical protein